MNCSFGHDVKGIATVDRDTLKSNADQSAQELDSLLAGMLSNFDLDNDDQLDKLMEQSLGELKPLPGLQDSSMDDIFAETLGYMPDMETELLSFNDIAGESPDDLSIDELHSQLESLFGDIQLTKKNC